MSEEQRVTIWTKTNSQLFRIAVRPTPRHVYSLTSQSWAILDQCAAPWPGVGAVMTGMISWISSLRADLASRVVP